MSVVACTTIPSAPRGGAVSAHGVLTPSEMMPLNW